VIVLEHVKVSWADDLNGKINAPVCPLGEVPTPNAEMGWKCWVVYSTPLWEEDSYVLALRRDHVHFPDLEEWCVASWNPAISRGWHAADYALTGAQALVLGGKKCEQRGGGERWVVMADAARSLNGTHFLHTRTVSA
jgi:hypothetical protein